jgi:L-rhamnonate dehydratase
VKITEVEAIILRQPAVNDAIADGSQDDLIIRIETDDGITGIGEVDSAPEIVKAAIKAPNPQSNSIGLRHIVLGQDPFDDEIWKRMHRGRVYFGRRGVAVRAMSGIDALWVIKGKKLGKPVCELPDALYQEYCVADTPINDYLLQKLPLDDEGFVSIPISPGLGVDLDQEILRLLRTN